MGKFVSPKVKQLSEKTNFRVRNLSAFLKNYQNYIQTYATKNKLYTLNIKLLCIVSNLVDFVNFGLVKTGSGYGSGESIKTVSAFFF